MVPPEFRKQVKNALDHLYDPAYLAGHPLRTQLTTSLAGTGHSGAEHLRAVLQEGIAALRPPPSVVTSSPEWRGYYALHYRYVQGQSIGAVEQALGIRTRQMQRELQKGIDALSALLWSRRSGPPAAPPVLPPGETHPVAAHPGPSQAQPVVLLATKLARPRLPATLVARERLLRDLDAAELVISLATVKKHVSNLLNKLDVTSRTQAIARARGRPPLG